MGLLDITVDVFTGEAIQIALNSVHDTLSKLDKNDPQFGTGGVVRLKPGNYLIEEPIIIRNSHTHIIGAGKTLTKLRLQKNIHGIVVAKEAHDEQKLRGIKLSSFSLMSNVPPVPSSNIDEIFHDTDAVGIRLTNTAYAVVADMQIHDFRVGLRLEDASNSRIEHVVCSNTYEVSEDYKAEFLERTKEEWRFIGFDIYSSIDRTGCISSVFFGCHAINEVSKRSVVQGVYEVERVANEHMIKRDSIGFRCYGRKMNDLQFSAIETSGCSYGMFFDFSGAFFHGRDSRGNPIKNANGWNSYDVQLNTARIDRFTKQGILVRQGDWDTRGQIEQPEPGVSGRVNVPDTSLIITNSWFNPSAYYVGLADSDGQAIPLTKSHACILGDVTSGLIITNNQFQNNASQCNISRNPNVPFKSGVTGVILNSSSRCVIANNLFDRQKGIELKRCKKIKVGKNIVQTWDRKGEDDYVIKT